ncbi:MAG: aldose 1-epimerase family protein [Eubacteriales bacterium]|nr:aldose 1-epimerase family protein [Eubacteriales bacterium]
MYILENKDLKITMNEKGAELTSIMHDGKEYLWNADPKYWGRCAPVLFPFVGSVNGGTYLYEGKEYKMGQHGFARDNMFTMCEQTENEVWFCLKDTEDTYVNYPFHFALYIGYVLEGKKLSVKWKVENTDTKELLFSIGGHPAFMCPIDGCGKQTDYALLLKKHGQAVQEVTVGVLADGLLSEETFTLQTVDGLRKIDETMFDRDALIIEKQQLDAVSLVDSDGTPYVTVKFDTPLMGIWSPAKKQAPFVCIEPWYGRCDRRRFDGELGEREYGNRLEVGACFQGGFDIIIDN